MSYMVQSTWIEDQVGAHLEAMVASGFWGENMTEVVASLVLEGVRRALRDRLIRRLPNDATPESADTTAFKCAKCHDGLLNSRKCEACGAEPEIPF